MIDPLTQTITSRALVALDGAGVDFRGTYHKPRDRYLEPNLRASAANRLAIVFINALSTPRSGYSDSAVYWAESFAAMGYPVFRFDLPGLGDTCGEIPPELLAFITAGGYGPVLRHKVKELAETFDLSGIVLAGHCAGAVTALYAAREHRTCKGLLLMDPYFNHPQRMTAKLPAELVYWSRKTRLGTLLRSGYNRARELSRTKGLPASANLGLLEQWRHAASKGLPILLLHSPRMVPAAGQFDYLAYAMSLAGRRSRLAVQSIPDADHSFSNSAGRDAVRREAEAWLTQCFPVHEGFAPALELTSSV